MKKNLLCIALFALPFMGFSQYCTNTIPFNCTDGDVIRNVTFAGINNDSECGNPSTGYSNYTTSVGAAQVMVGNPYTVSVKVGPSGDGWMYESVGVWIDYNHNNIFDTNEYTYVGTGLNQVLSKEISIPGDATPGNTRMRVVVSAAQASAFGDQFKCGPLIADNPYGEMEDYTVTISPAVACSGTPDAGNATASVSSICPNTPFTLSFTGTPMGGYSYQWQSSTDGGDNWYYLGSAQASPSYSVTAQSITTSYRVTVTCTNSSASATSNPVIVTQKPPTECYCTAGATSTSFEKISNVKLTTSDNSTTIINNPSTATAGYEDFTSVVGNVAAGSQYNFTATFSGTSFDNDQVMVWIDLDGNGSFNDPGEQVLVTPTKKSPWEGTITIPAGTTPKTTRMRVRLHDSVLTPNSTPCGTSSFGQVEDYTLNIGVLAVSNVSKTNIKSYPNPVKDIFNIETQGKIKSVKVFDASGKQIFTKDLNEAKFQIDFSRFTSGVYVVTTILQDGSSTSTKVIKK